METASAISGVLLKNSPTFRNLGSMYSGSVLYLTPRRMTMVTISVITGKFMQASEAMRTWMS